MTRKSLLILPFVALLMYDCCKHGFMTSRSKTHRLIEGVQIFAVIPAEHVADARGEKLLYASSSGAWGIDSRILSAHHAVLPLPVNRCIQFDLDIKARFKNSEARRGWDVEKWILQIPHQEPIEFTHLDDNTGWGLLTIPNLERTRANEIHGMMYKKVQMNFYEMITYVITYVDWERVIMWFLIILFVTAICSNAIADKRPQQVSVDPQAKRDDDKLDDRPD